MLVRGDVPLREVNRELALELVDAGGGNTLGGLCLFLAGGVPRAGTRLQAHGGTTLCIERASARAVELIRLIRAEPSSSPAAELPSR